MNAYDRGGRLDFPHGFPVLQIECPPAILRLNKVFTFNEQVGIFHSDLESTGESIANWIKYLR